MTRIDVDALAQEIRRVDGSHSLGAGALAEALMPFLCAAPAPSIDAVSGLVEELREESRSLQSVAWSRLDGGQNFSLAAIILDRVADALEALAKEPPHAEAARSEIAARRQLEAQTRELSHDSATATLEAQVADLTAQLHAQARELAEARERVSILEALTATPLFSHRALTAKLCEIMATRFGVRFLDPPDGGDVPIHEQVERMADALAKPAPAVEAVREALQTSLSEMLEARDRLLCYHARTSGLDHGIEEARRALAALAPAAQAGTVAQEGRDNG